MAPGNQLEKGTWALLARAPATMSAPHTARPGVTAPAPPGPSNSPKLQAPAPTPSPTRPTSIMRLPAPVITRLRMAPSRALGLWCQKPMSRNETRLVSSQNT
ncbi:hypothetical protein D3C86_1357960 [compost metagenome]